jgi:hypothetical protein
MEELSADAFENARHRKDFCHSLFWLHKIIKILIVIIFFDTSNTDARLPRVDPWRIDWDELIKLGTPTLVGATFVLSDIANILPIDTEAHVG